MDVRLPEDFRSVEFLADFSHSYTAPTVDVETVRAAEAFSDAVCNECLGFITRSGKCDCPTGAVA